jgi:hypothetical protein
MTSLPDRIDFTILPDGRVLVLKLHTDTTDPLAPRDIPTSNDVKPAGFDLERALDWCKNQGYAVRRWPGGARAWAGGHPWVIRTAAQILYLRQRNPLSCMDYAYEG